MKLAVAGLSLWVGCVVHLEVHLALAEAVLGHVAARPYRAGNPGAHGVMVTHDERVAHVRRRDAVHIHGRPEEGLVFPRRVVELGEGGGVPRPSRDE